MVKKIIIMNDFVKSYLTEKGMEGRSSVLKNLYSYQLNKATGLEVETIYDNLEEKKFMELNNVLDYENIDRFKTWALLSNNITKESEDYLVSLLKDTFVFGHHLPNMILDVLERNNIPFIDTFETAFRYMQDCYLGIRSSIKEIREYVLTNSLSTNTMYVYANYLKSFYGHGRTSFKLDENSCLLLGQTPYDSVLIKEDGTFASLSEYKEEILNFSKKYNTIYVKDHPGHPLREDIKNFLSKIPNVKEIDYNFYELMAQDNIKEVFGLNSGAISEAKFFGKKQTFLLNKSHRYYQDGGDINDYKTFVMLKSNSYIFKINFWADLLSFIMPTYKVLEHEEVTFDNYQQLFSNALTIPTSYELNIYSVYNINRYLVNIRNLENSIHLEKKIEEYKYSLEESNKRINECEYFIKKSNNRYKKLLLNICLGFIPSKRYRKEIRGKFLK